MALSTAERAQLRLYLGYSNLHRYLNTRLEGAFDAVDTDAETLVRNTMASVAAIDTALTTSATNMAGVKTADEVTFFGHGQGSRTEEQRRQGMMLIGRISMLLGVPFYGNYFDVKGYPGDRFSDEMGMGLLPGGGTGMLRLG